MAYDGNGQDDEQQQILQQLMGGMNQTQQQGPAVPYSGPAPQETAFDGGGGAAASAPQGNGVQARKALGGYNSTGTMLGFNTALDYPDDKAANSMKNTFGRIASRYANKPSSIDAIMADADFQRYFPGAKKVAGGAGDKIDFGGMLSDFESGVPVGVVDVLGAADPNADTSAGWTWQDEANDGGGAMAAMGGGAGGGDPLAALLGGAQGNLDALGQSDALAQILAVLAGENGGQLPQQGADPLAALLGRG